MVFAVRLGFWATPRPFVAGAWQKFVFSFADFGGIDGSDIMGIAWKGGPKKGTYEFRLDNVRLE